MLIHINEQFQPCYDAHTGISSNKAVSVVGADKMSSIASTTKNNVSSSSNKKGMFFQWKAKKQHQQGKKTRDIKC